MPLPTFRNARRFLAPRWLTQGVGGLIGYALDVVKDAAVRRVELGHLARFPGSPESPAGALEALGRDRRVVRGRSETSAAYAARLLDWLDERRTAGNPYTLMRQIAAYCGGTGVVIKTVDNRGNWYQRAANGAQTAYLAQGNWDWDGDAAQWARFWVIVHVGDVWTTGETWGGAGAVWGDGSTWGSTATYDDVEALRAIVLDWRPLGTKCMNVILAFDPASFDPTDPPGPPLPDGLWGSWSKIVGGVSVPARLATARYLPGA